METRKIRLTQIEANTGQIEGLPANPRRWTDIEMDRLKESILQTPELFEARGLIVYPLEPDRYIVLGGNMRYAAARKLALREVPCIILPADTTPEKMREIVIKDNGSFGQWDTDLLASDWNIDDLGEWGVDTSSFMQDQQPEESQAEDDGYDVEEKLARIKEPKTRRGDLFRLGTHRLLCGDSTRQEDIDLLMQEDTADLVVTDPPYNVDYTGGTKDALKIQNDKMNDLAFYEFLLKTFSETCRICKPGAGIYIFHASCEAVNFIKAMTDAGFLHKQQLIWVKNSITLGRQDYQWQHEPILYGWKEGAAHYFIDDRTQRTVIDDRLDVDKMSKAQLRDMLKDMLEAANTSVIDEDKPLRNAEHPTMKPIPLVGRLIRNSSRRNQVVVDFFGGSGSTLMAAEQLGRRCRTMELDPVYCDVIIDRWEKLTGLKAEKISSIV